MLKQVKQALLHIWDYFRHKKSYSQDGEDVVLASFYEGEKGYKGFYVDVGASHPVRFSNTLFFYKRKWQGINIDPTPGSMKPFRWLRQRDINLEFGIGPNSDKLTFYCFNQPELNTFDAELAEKRNTGKPYKIVKTLEVPIEPLAAVLDKYLPHNTTIDFMSIDVEGLDLEVLKSNNWEKYLPKFILAEDLNFSPTNFNQSEIFNFLTLKGYHLVAVLKRTIIFRHNST
ncbi:MAG: FkbM family methyltransferase [Saprospiraceae bacterium]|nr:FkbM family methyltransferase [Saprospiraceae bacterium]